MCLLSVAIECNVSLSVSTWVKCACKQLCTLFFPGVFLSFFFFNGMRVSETDVQTAALSHISPSCMYSSEPWERLSEQVNNHI